MRADLHAAVQHDHHVRTRVALAEQDRAPRVARHAHVGDQAVQLVGLEPTEQRVLLEQLALVDQRRVRHAASPEAECHQLICLAVISWAQLVQFWRHFETTARLFRVRPANNE
jgi:hypothetical protein